jgi:hypothetical protein
VSANSHLIVLYSADPDGFVAHVVFTLTIFTPTFESPIFLMHSYLSLLVLALAASTTVAPVLSAGDTKPQYGILHLR